MNYEIVERYLAEFFNISKKEVYDWCINGDKNAQDRWLKDSPQTEEEINRWYTSSWEPIFSTVGWHYLQCFSLRGKLSKRLQGRVLNYGCGIATESFLAAKERGIKSDLYDISGIVTGFTNFMIQGEGLKDLLRFVTIDRLVQYDTIVCVDVLEHTIDPRKLCELFKKHLKSDGVLLIRAPFWQLKPSHLPQHKNLELGKLLVEHNLWERSREVDV